MSATKRGTARRQADFYETPAKAVETLLRVHYLRGPILEPCAGSGAIAKAIRQYYDHRPKLDITAVEIREEERAALEPLARVHIADFLHWQPDRQYGTIITNPPFSLAEQVIERALQIAGPRTEIVLLLRLAFLESQRRQALWQRWTLRRIYVLSQRPSFTGAGTDATAYGWFLFQRGHKTRNIQVI